MDDDTRDAIADLREDLDREAQRYERANERLTPASATDRTRAVTVRLDAAGHLHSVVVSESWRDALGPQGLAGGILEAFASAAAERARVWGEAVARVKDEPAPQTRPAQPLYTTLPGQLQEIADRQGEPPTEATVEALREMVADLRRGMREVFDNVDARLQARLSGTSRSGHVTATVTGSGGLESLDFDHRWLAVAHAFNVSRECTEAIHAALAEVPSADLAGLVEGTALERVNRVTQDAEALAAFVRQHER